MKWRCRAGRVHIYRGNKLKIALNGKHSGTEEGVVLSREKKQSHLQAAIAVCTSAPLHHSTYPPTPLSSSFASLFHTLILSLPFSSCSSFFCSLSAHLKFQVAHATHDNGAHTQRHPSPPHHIPSPPSSAAPPSACSHIANPPADLT